VTVLRRSLVAVVVCAAATSAGAQSSQANRPPEPANRYLAVPFENTNREGRLYWLSEGSAVVLTDDKAIRTLNRDWRRKDAATNVLSFPAQDPVKNPTKKPTRKPGKTRSRKARAARGTPRLLGDIVIAYETTEREARAERKPFAHHLAHLAVHGFLHLVGYDHAADDEADAMEGLETAILARLDVPDPYIARGARAVSVSETARDSLRSTRFLRRTASPLRRKML